MPPTRPAIDDPLNAFCTDTEAFLPGAASGPLAGLRFAAKDIFDVAGHISGGGNPDWKATHEAARHTAWAVQILVDAGAAMVGKTHTDELTRGIFGENAHYGTPINPRAPGRVPGGSRAARPWPGTWWILPWVRIPAVQCAYPPVFAASTACAQPTGGSLWTAS